MVTLIVVRHGETDYNVEERIQGQERDVPLNANGVAQVEALRDRLAEHCDRLVSSPLQRARQTAEILNRGRARALELDDDLKEFSFGRLGGELWRDVPALSGDPDIRERDRRLEFDYRPYGGESVDDVRVRVARFVARWRDAASVTTVLVTCHGGVIRVLHELLPNREDGGRGNASVHVFAL
jgi:broad specificity phosphatase PhoE